jgi:hypothetical protein
MVHMVTDGCIVKYQKNTDSKYFLTIVLQHSHSLKLRSCFKINSATIDRMGFDGLPILLE